MATAKRAAKAPAKKAAAKKAPAKKVAKKAPAKKAAPAPDPTAPVIRQEHESGNDANARANKRVGWYEAHDAFCDFGPYDDPRHGPDRHDPCPYDDPVK